MSHQTGIGAADTLKQFFAASKDGRIRMIKVAIENEQLVLAHSEETQGSWEEDWDNLVPSHLEEAQPCYIMYRLDSKDATGYQWVYISYSPDNSAVREKMLYAATRSTLKMEFGSGQIKEEVFGTMPHEVNLRGYKKHLAANQAPAPLTNAEEELEIIKKSHSDASVDSKTQTLTGVAFPVSEDALAKLRDLQAGNLNYVQLSIDLQAETIELASFEDTDIHKLASRIPLDHARYHFFTFKHSHEGDYLESVVFIYSMPGYNCSIKERMLYSSCKSPLLDTVEQHIGMEIVRKLEVDDPKEINEQFIYEEVHPKKTIVKQQFARPPAPRGRGPKRVIRTNPQSGE